MNVTITGQAEVLAKLKSLQADGLKKIMRSAIRAGAKSMLMPAKMAAPVNTGFLLSSLRVMTKSNKRRATLTASVGSSRKDYGTRDFYLPFVKYGRVNGNRGRTRPNDFIGRVFDSHSAAAVSIAISEAEKKAQKLINLEV